MSECIVKVNKVSKKYNIYKKNFQRIAGVLLGKEAAEVKHALTDVSFKMEKGDRMIIFGVAESGCSTLMKIIAGVTSPSKGKVEVDGSINAMLNVRVGYDYEYTCRENIYLKANVVGISKEIVRQNEEDIIGFAEMEDYLDLPMKRAPKGVAVRLALALHLLVESDILMIDDPLSQGGIVSRTKCEDKIKKYADQNPNMTFIISNNDKVLARKVCNKGLVMRKGEIVFEGSAEDACTMYKGK